MRLPAEWVDTGWLPRHVRQAFQASNDKLTDTVGGPARRKAVLLLASVLSLASADVGAVSALAPQLEDAFRVGNTGIGLLVTVSTLVGAAATLPVGVLTDRISRTRLLSVSIVIWGVAELASGFATSFLMLIVIRVALGAVTATALPAVASLTGDLFAANERSRIYGWILTGELIGTGIGIVIAGDLGAALSWRVGLAALALPSLALAWGIYRYFPEPARGGQSRLVEGAEEIPSSEEVEAHPEDFQPPADGSEDLGPADENPVVAMVEEGEVEPNEELIVTADRDLSLWEAIRWVFSVPTNVHLIVASALGYFYFSGLRTFALIYARGRFGLGESGAMLVFVLLSAAAVVGVLVSGRSTDGLIRSGKVDARLLVGGVGFLAASVVFVPALLSSTLWIALVLFAVAAFFQSVPNPPMDAARLDVVPSHMWGRAESIRTAVRTVLEALAPLMFGLLSATLGGGAGGGFGAGVNSSHAAVSPPATRGLEYAFLVMVVAQVAAGLILLRARRSYLTDVASAAASEQAGPERAGRLQRDGTAYQSCGER